MGIFFIKFVPTFSNDSVLALDLFSLFHWHLLANSYDGNDLGTARTHSNNGICFHGTMNHQYKCGHQESTDRQAFELLSLQYKANKPQSNLRDSCKNQTPNNKTRLCTPCEHRINLQVKPFSFLV
jgi:nicotinic acid phosphoribosyltransferase